MTPTLELAEFRKVAAWEHAVRFAFGGAITVIAGIVAHVYGPATGGLLLAFPAILPASLTLVARHEGRRRAGEEARGAILGAVALVVFAASVRALAERWPPPIALTAASAAWLVSALLLWGLVHGRSLPRTGDPKRS